MNASPPSAYRWVLLFGVWLLYCAFALIASSLAPLVGLVEADLEISHVAMGSIMGAWQLVFIFSAIPCGVLLDRLGTRTALTIGGLFLAASAFGRAVADSYLELLLAVMLFGVGGPIVSSGAPKVVAEWFTGSSRGLAMGIYVTGLSVGGIVSLTLTHSLLLPELGNSWRNVMLLWAAFAVVCSLVWLLVASHTSVGQARAIQLKSEQSIPQFQVVKELLKSPAVRLLLLMGAGVFLFNHGLAGWLPEMLRAGGMTLTEAGYWAAIPTAIGLIGALVIPRLATPERRFRILTLLSLSAAGASLFLHADEGPLLVSGLLLQGVARSALMTVLVLTLVELPTIGDRYAGVASGIFFSAAEIGGVLGPVALGLLYDLTGEFQVGLIMLTGVALALSMAGRKLQRLAKDEAGGEVER